MKVFLINETKNYRPHVGLVIFYDNGLVETVGYCYGKLGFTFNNRQAWLDNKEFKKDINYYNKNFRKYIESGKKAKNNLSYYSFDSIESAIIFLKINPLNKTPRGTKIKSWVWNSICCIENHFFERKINFIKGKK